MKLGQRLVFTLSILLVALGYFTLQFINWETPRDSGFVNITDSCDGVICPESIITCPDGLNFTCPNVCINGKCTQCVPDCSGHEKTNPCKDVVCPEKEKTCPDGYTAKCQSACDPDTGECVICTPDCTGHENPANECKESWVCSQWGDCVDGLQTRECIDENNCGTTENKPSETQTCELSPIPNHVLFSEIYYDTIGKESDNEWIELFNPTKTILDISGYIIKDNTGSWVIPNGTTIKAGGYLVIARNATSFHNIFGCKPDISGLTLALSNTGDKLEILTPDGILIDFVAWENYIEGWNIEADEDKSIKRDPINVDTNSPKDWLSNQTPHPGLCY
jgi:hypothetical protein